jgi:hypothetical protein
MKKDEDGNEKRHEKRQQITRREGHCGEEQKASEDGTITRKNHPYRSYRQPRHGEESSDVHLLRRWWSNHK